MNSKLKQEKRLRRHKRVRAKIFGTVERPRLCVFKSNKHIYAQIINDEKGRTLVVANDQEIKKSLRRRKVASRPQGKTTTLPPPSPTRQKGELAPSKSEEIKTRAGKIAIAFEVGKLIAEKAIKNNVEKVVFDKASYRYQGRVKALAEGAREGGLKF